MKFNFDVFGFEVGFIFSARKKRTTPIGGITNRTKDGMFVVFLDYDNIEYDWMIDELKSIQTEYFLSDFYVFQSSKNSFHAVCFDKLTRELYQEILHRSSCDPVYKKVPWTWGKRLNTLRVTDKQGRGIRYIAVIRPAVHENCVQSHAHREFFKKTYSLKLPKASTDGQKDLIMARYVI